jgi:signal transduction histidine kinase
VRRGASRPGDQLAVVGTITSNIWRQRVQARLIGYGSAALVLMVAAMTGHLDEPLVPVSISMVGLAFAIPVRRFAPYALAAAVIFDAVAVIYLALVAGSWLLGGIALFVAGTTVTIGRPMRTVVPVAAVTMTGATLLVLGEQGLIERPAFIPLLASPVDTVAALVMTVLLALTGVAAVKRLVSLYGRAAVGVEDSTRRWWDFMEATERPMLVAIDGVIEHANQAAARVCGRPEHQLVGTTLSSLVTDGTLSRPDGSRAHVETVSAPLAVDGYLAEAIFLVDVSDDEEQRRRLERAVRETDRFVAGVSHEVRTPLTAVVGLSSLADEAWDELSPAERREFVRLIASQSREVASIIEDLLVAARAGGQGVRIDLGGVDILHELESVLATLEMESRLVTVQGSGSAHADAGRVRQIIRNLVTNSIRYGGQAIIATVRTNGDEVELEVADNGPPIPEQARETIFEPFAKGGTSLRRHDSVGLGLSVSRQLAELMHGRLSYDHRDGWSRFTLSLPTTRSLPNRSLPNRSRPIRSD